MRSTDIPLLAPLRLALPDERRCLLLRSCLWKGEPGRAAWTDWLEAEPDPIGFIRAGTVGVKGLLPLLYAGLRGNRSEVPEDLQTVLRAAYLKEQVRSQTFDTTTCLLVDGLARSGVIPTIVGGPDLAHSVYEEPYLRHSDRLELLIRAEDEARSMAALEDLGCTRTGDGTGSAPAFRQLRHSSGLNIVVRTRLPGPAQIDHAEFLGSSRTMTLIGGDSMQILPPLQNLLFICTRVYDARSTQSLGWPCDVWFLLNNSPDLDWPSLSCDELPPSIALAMWLTLEFVRGSLNAPVPEGTLEALAGTVCDTPADSLMWALAASRRAEGGGFREIFRRALGWREQLFVVRWIFREILPNPIPSRSLV